MRASTAASHLALSTLLSASLLPTPAAAQTPSPLAEWQFSAGIMLEQMFTPNMPTWRIRLGPGVVFQPRYDGADSYHVIAGPSIDIRYRDRYFLSTGEGLGVNLLTGPNWRAGFTVSYELGRRSADDPDHLHGLNNINPAPSAHLFGEYVISKSFPLVIRADLLRDVGGDNGWIGDLGAYMPMPGSSEKFAWFAGPTLTFADSRYMNSWFGITPAEAVTSGRAAYSASAGMKSFGFGIAATWIPAKHWFVSGNVAFQQLVGSAAKSPITQSAGSGVIEVSVDYQF
ncbi:MAG TPA: MipA/OmpV family protein [Trinickia sp.]|jgi:outer membrane scaffolding protein for murein synthesis (MipA/OmpV family)|uniref:MipA/OmpV family protein n=1 Tax=Trinickia sp. TaxID=2571163 RepID=UPI002BC2F91B|nr:MipA/OmpV family protein [Trinickia sp.]HTI17549.1 MipA/OmpV family protein [Trinickia sp.]